MFSFDVAAVAALWMWTPNDCSSAWRFPAVLCLSLLPVAGLLGFAAAPPHEPIFAEIDLGDIAQGATKQQSFQAVNDSGTHVEVAAVETSCPCASVRMERSDVPAGQFLAGSVTLDLRHKPDFVGDLVIEAKALTKDGRVALVLLIRARVYPASQAGKGTL